MSNAFSTWTSSAPDRVEWPMVQTVGGSRASAADAAASVSRASSARIREALAVMHCALHLLEPERLVCRVADVVVEQCVGGQLRVALLARPCLCRVQQCPAHAAAAQVFIDVPALHVRRPAAASFRVVADRQLEEAAEPSVLTLGHEHDR